MDNYTRIILFLGFLGIVLAVVLNALSAHKKARKKPKKLHTGAREKARAGVCRNRARKDKQHPDSDA